MFFQGPNIRKIEFPPDLDPDLAKELAKKEYNIAILKWIASIIGIGVGLYLIVVGVQSDASMNLSIKRLGLDMHLNKAMPGIVIVVFSFLLLIFSRIKILIK